MLRVEDITHSYKSGNEWTSVLHKINFSINQGRWLHYWAARGPASRRSLI